MNFSGFRNACRLSVVVRIALLVCLGSAHRLAAASVPDHEHALPNWDRRSEMRAGLNVAPAALSPARVQAEAALRARLPDLEMERHGITGSPKWLRARDGFLTGPGGSGRGAAAAPGPGLAATDAQRIVKSFVREHAAVMGHDDRALDAARISRDFTNERNGLHTTTWQQQHAGIDLFEAVFLAHTTRAGELVNLSSQFVSDAGSAATNGHPPLAKQGLIAPAIVVEEALRRAAVHLGDEEFPLVGINAQSPPSGPARRQQFRGGAIKGEADICLCWLPMSESELKLCWRITIDSRAQSRLFDILVDAQSGEILVRHCLTADATAATYRVFTRDSPTPFLPGYSSLGNDTQPAAVSRQLLTLTSLSPTASPNGWINDGDNETRGNNVDAHLDLDADNVADTPRPQGSPARVFDFSMDLSKQPTQYRSAAVVQVFYLCNWLHDKLYDLGFTEAAGNFQNNNFGRGGSGSDAVQADVHDGEGVNNANFSTPSDGIAPRMQMYLYPDPATDRDGGLDATLVVHEYVHGLSNRRVGGGALISANQTSGMGEGWSDFYALALLSPANSDADGVYQTSAYARFGRVRSGVTYANAGDNYYFGNRTYPYSTDMSKSPWTFKDIDPGQIDPHANVPRSPVAGSGGAGEVHQVGEVWCVMLWECRAALVKKHGFASGNQLILELVTDGMGLCPVNPTFVQARDAILQADQVNNGGANTSILWNAFAKRGLGRDAQAPPSNTTTGVVENFDNLDPLHVITPITLKVRGPEGGPFESSLRTFTLKNEGAASLNWSVQVQPPLEVSVSSGALAPGATRAVNVSVDANAAAFFPIGLHPLSIVFSNHTSHEVMNRTYRLQVVPPGEPLVQKFDGFDSFDLDFRRLTFTPEGAAGYHVCRDTALVFPVPTDTATSISFPNDGFVKIGLTSSKRVTLFGKQYPSVYVSMNGALSVEAPDEGLFQLGDHFQQPRVSAFFRDIVTNSTSRISYEQLSDRFVATWERVLPFGFNQTNNFQIELFFDGMLRISFLDMATSTGITGLSDGEGFPVDLVQADFSQLPDCDTPPLALALPSSVSEGTALRPGAGIVSIPAARSVPTIVTLSSSDVTELTVPSTVTIPARQTSTSFDVTIVNDGVRDGPQLVYVTASALNLLPALSRVRVDDNDNNPLSLSVTLFVSETGGAIKGVITVPNPVSGVVTVALSTSNTNEVAVPPIVFIPSGQTSTTFNATAIDDRRIDGTVQTLITASVHGWTAGSDSVNVFDNEDRVLRFRLPFVLTEGAGTLTNSGEVYLSGTLETNLMVSLYSSNAPALLPLGPVTIPAGQTNALFPIQVGDNAILDGIRFVALAATASVFSNAVSSIILLDNDQPPQPANPYPPDDATNWALNTHLAWNASEGELIVNGGFESGDFTGWTVDGFGGGGWTLNPGTFDPDSPDGARTALLGSFEAMSYQNGNGLHTLSQEFFIPEGATGTQLGWRHEISNHAGSFTATHRFAVELRRAEDNLLLSTLFSTSSNSPAFSGPTNLTVSLQPWRGERVRLVFVEEDSLGYMNVHLDNVSVLAASAAQTTYDVYFGTDSQPDFTEYLGSTTNAFWDLLPLAGGLHYYWRIDSRRQGVTNNGPVWNFSTAGSSLSGTTLGFGSSWKYLANGSNPGTAWRSTRFSDTTWDSGVAPLGFGTSQATTIGVAANDYTSFYFRTRLTLADTNRLATVTASLKRDDGAIVYVNGVEAFRDNMPSGVVSSTTQAASIVTGADGTNAILHAIDPALFVEGVNIIAVEVHQHDSGFPFFSPSTDLFFDMALTMRTNNGNMAPASVRWIAPSDFVVVRTPTNLLLQVEVIDDALAGMHVRILEDEQTLLEDSVAPFNLTWNNPSVGFHTLVATATDSGGLSASSVPLHILVLPEDRQSFITLVPAGANWRYHDNGDDPGRGWNTLGYREPNNRSWAGGPAQLGYGDGDEATTLGVELDRFDKPITTYFRHKFDAAMDVAALKLRVLRDDGVALYLNGREAFRSNLPAGVLGADTLALAAISGAAENLWLESTNIPASWLIAGQNIVAAELHQSSSATPDASFDLELTALGNPLPEVAILSPAAGTVLLTPAAVQVDVTATDAYGAVSLVKLFSDGLLIGQTSSKPYQFNWAGPSPGVHTLAAVAVDNQGATNRSGSVSVTILPPINLGIAQSPNSVELRWSDIISGYTLELCTNLTPPIVWQTDTNPVSQSGGFFRVTVPSADPQRYYRLRGP